MQKNVAGQKIGAQLISATDGSAFTGSATVEVTIDAGTQATGTVGSGACTHEGNGYHTYAPSQAETNGTLLAFTFHGTGAVPVTVQVFTTGYDPTAAQIPANVTQISGDTTAADNAESFFDGTGYAGTNNVIPTVTNVTNAPGAIRSNTAQAGAAGTITLDASASATNDLYNGAIIVLTGGAGAGQCNGIIDYNGTTKVATVSHTWATNPDNTTTFTILPMSIGAWFGRATSELNESVMPKKSGYTAVARAVHATANASGTLSIPTSSGGAHASQTLTTLSSAQPIISQTGAA